MFEKYIATQQDFDIIKEALSFLNREELNFIFPKRDLISNTALVTYDSKYMYVIRLDGSIEKIVHFIEITDEDQFGWRAYVYPDGLQNKLKDKDLEYISGPLPTPFIELQKADKKGSPYTTKESYLAMIIHEFGHVYYEHIKGSCFSNFTYNISLMETAVSLLEGNKLNLDNFKIRLPHRETEVYAFCTDYTATTLFWPEYKKVLDKDYLESTLKYLSKEKVNKEHFQESVLDDPHIESVVIGKILIEKFGNDWVTYLLN